MKTLLMVRLATLFLVASMLSACIWVPEDEGYRHNDYHDRDHWEHHRDHHDRHDEDRDERR